MSEFPSDLTPMVNEWDRWRTHEGAEEWKRIQALFMGDVTDVTDDEPYEVKPDQWDDPLLEPWTPERWRRAYLWPFDDVTAVTDDEAAGS